MKSFASRIVGETIRPPARLRLDPQGQGATKLPKSSGPRFEQVVLNILERLASDKPDLTMPRSVQKKVPSARNRNNSPGSSVKVNLQLKWASAFGRLGRR